ncbi:hypothetical protein L211DRAFT_690456 [Terfezia boudieri ATCC MYA-4762]|uniref:Uncharacterized protein n=1 Tax=Terfezia boudieri ATCC MYA-4762 TaxID=1051890 RepID=A0A3N4LDJ8_9PEZI|nr:hypothetical protein L211DRAFT_690456 [Terfezia boudieri ATCC MYA-4762]
MEVLPGCLARRARVRDGLIVHSSIVRGSDSTAPTRSPRLPLASITESRPGLNNSHIRSPMGDPLQSSGGRGQSSITENDIWRRLFESQPGVPQTQRITYVGEAWHLSWVLHQKTGSAPLHFAGPIVDGSRETSPARRIGSAEVPLENPDPKNSRFTQTVSEIAGGNSQVASAIQVSIDAFVLPPEPIRDALIKAYFSHFHPFFPILNTERFESHLNSSMTMPSFSPDVPSCQPHRLETILKSFNCH